MFVSKQRNNITEVISRINLVFINGLTWKECMVNIKHWRVIAIFKNENVNVLRMRLEGFSVKAAAVPSSRWSAPWNNWDVLFSSPKEAVQRAPSDGQTKKAEGNARNMLGILRVKTNPKASFPSTKVWHVHISQRGRQSRRSWRNTEKIHGWRQGKWCGRVREIHMGRNPSQRS